MDINNFQRSTFVHIRTGSSMLPPDDLVVRVFDSEGHVDFSCHKWVLSAYSEYFRSMLFGPGSSMITKEEKNRSSPVADQAHANVTMRIIEENGCNVDRTLFGLLLKYMYNDKDFEELMASASLAKHLHLIMAADRWGVQDLVTYLTQKVITRKGLTYTEAQGQAYLLTRGSLLKEMKALSRVFLGTLGNTPSWFLSDQFTELDRLTLADILTYEHLEVDEFVLIEGLINWVLKNTGGERSPANVRGTLGVMAYRIRPSEINLYDAMDPKNVELLKTFFFPEELSALCRSEDLSGRVFGLFGFGKRMGAFSYFSLDFYIQCPGEQNSTIRMTKRLLLLLELSPMSSRMVSKIIKSLQDDDLHSGFMVHSTGYPGGEKDDPDYWSIDLLNVTPDSTVIPEIISNHFTAVTRLRKMGAEGAGISFGGGVVGMVWELDIDNLRYRLRLIIGRRTGIKPPKEMTIIGVIEEPDELIEFLIMSKLLASRNHFLKLDFPKM